MRNWCDGRVRGCDWQDLFFKMMAIDHRFIGLILRAKPVQVSGVAITYQFFTFGVDGSYQDPVDG